MKVFISYSWTSKEYQERVAGIVQKLRGAGVDVVFDLWDLGVGDDMYAFMERMINSEDITKVLIMCDSGYKAKADGRNGGVGTETQIITPQLYSSIVQSKFIPLVTERDCNNIPYLPFYLASRKYIDFSGSNEEESFEELLRVIYERPRFMKPPLGQMPIKIKNPTEIRFKEIAFCDSCGQALIMPAGRLEWNYYPGEMQLVHHECSHGYKNDTPILSDMIFDQAIYNDPAFVFQRLLELKDEEPDLINAIENMIPRILE